MKKKFNNWENTIQKLKSDKKYEELIKSCYYDDPIESAILRYEKSNEWHQIIKLLNEYKVQSGRILDFGAGRGICSIAFAKRNYEVFSLDDNDGNNAGLNSFQNLKDKSNLKLNLINADFKKIPVEDEYFDFIFARQSLHHSKNIDDSCKEIFRTLKKGGIFISIRDHVIDKKEDKEIFLKNHPLHEFTQDENAFLLKEYLIAFKKCGFKVLKVIKTYSSPLNYDPNTLENILIHYTKNKFILGSKFFNMMICSNNFFSNLIKSTLIYLINLNDRTPGRPYSFILEK